MNLTPSNQTNLYGLDKNLELFISLYKKINYQIRFYYQVKKVLEKAL